MNLTYPLRRTRVKICGFTRPEDAKIAAELGVDAIGLVFYRESPRCVSIAQAQKIAEVLPPFVSVVALFVDPERAWVRQVLERVPADLLQFHGDEAADYCGSFDLPYIKAVRMGDGVDLPALVQSYGKAGGLLLDAYHPEAKGGTGSRFDWDKIPTGLSRPIILAGGLTPENVRGAIEKVRPYAVDVSSGVEEKKGIKDAAKMAALLKEVQNIDYTRL